MFLVLRALISFHFIIEKLCFCFKKNTLNKFHGVLCAGRIWRSNPACASDVLLKHHDGLMIKLFSILGIIGSFPLSSTKASFINSL